MPASTPRTRLIFQNLNLYTGPAAGSGWTATGALFQVPGSLGPANTGNNLIAELANVQSCNLSLGINRQDLNIFGRLQRVGTLQIQPASISMDASWNATDGYNEAMLGLNHKGGSFLSGILTKVSDSKNYFLSVSPQGFDDDGYSNHFQRDVWALGNAFLSNYTFEASVGQVATTSISVEAMNIVTYTGSSGNQTPAVNPNTSSRISQWNYQLPVGRTITGANDVYALKPGDISLSFPTAAGFLVPLSGANTVNVQSFSMSVPIGREVIQALGSNWGISREIQFPVNCTLNIRALATEVSPNSYDSLICNDAFYDMGVLLRQPSCNGTGTAAITLGFNEAQLTNLSFGNTVGGDSTIDLTLSAQIAGPMSTDGITFLGSYGTVPGL